MLAKYFNAPDAESCYLAAEAHFGVNRESLYCRLTPAAPNADAMLLAIAPGPQGPAPLEQMDAFFNLDYEEDGVYLSLFQAHGQGQKLDLNLLSLYLQRKRFTGLNTAALPLLLDAGWGKSKIAPPQQERILHEEAFVEVDRTESAAFLTIWPADQGGQPLDRENVQAALKAAGVVHGLDETALHQLLQERALYNRYLVAQATPPEHGKNGYLTFHFRREFDMKPKQGEDGRVDYRTLELFENVTEGQLLVTRTPPAPGIPGYTVTGRELPPKPGKNLPLPSGTNTVANEDKTGLFAAVNGMVVYAGGRVNVSSVYTVNGNADMSVGNIDFDGSVIITGNVIYGLTIKASGNIEVAGVVEAATLIAGGNIVLRHGMQGMNKGSLTAGGSITANYLERATVMANGSVSANIIAHSIVEAGDSLTLKGKNGSLVGGSARVMNMVWAQTIGSATETITEVEVGLVPQKRARILFLQQEIKNLQVELEKLTTLANFYKNNKSDDPKAVSMAFSVLQSLKQKTQLLEEDNIELEALQEEAANAVHGKVHVSDTAYPGLRLTIASAIYRLLAETSHCTFRSADGVITFGAYEGY